MFQYIPKSMWFPTSVDIKQVATIEALEKLCKAGEVERVVIPFTYYGYGSSIIDDSNRRSIKRHYAANRFKDYGYSLTMSAYQFLKHSDFRELVEELQEKEPIFDDQDYSTLEHETKLEFIVDEISYVLINDDSYELFELLPDTLQETRELITELLEDYQSDEPIDWWDQVEIDTDGATPYATTEAVKELTELVKIKWERTK